MSNYGAFQASEEERLKMFKNSCAPYDPFGSLSSFADIFINLMLVKRIEQLENELTKSGIEIPEWYDIFPQGIEKEDKE
jgi:hypothetical protein